MSQAYRTAVWLAPLLLIAGPSAQAATLSAGRIEAAPGQRELALPFLLHSEQDQTVAGIQFDLVFDEDWLTLTDVEPGPAATAAGKDVAFSRLGPGVVRVIITGFNQQVIEDGAVAWASFDVAQGAADGPYTVEPTNVIMSNPFGVSVDAQAVAGSIVVGGGAWLADVNGDGRLNAVDVQLVIIAALGLDIHGMDADCDGDGFVNAVDVQFAINAVLGAL
jgi:hypothetical protein